MCPGRRILLADDEYTITDTYGPAMERLGFEVAIARDGEEALRMALSWRPDLIILDIGMPKMSGAEVLNRLRERGDETPVIVLSKYGDSDERATTLGQGADDYVNKPIGLAELVQRISRSLGRAAHDPGLRARRQAQVIASGDLVVDCRSWRVYLGSEATELAGRSVSLLRCLMDRPGELLTRAELLDMVWGWDWVGGTRTVDTHISRIRQALHDDVSRPRYIETVRAMGYRFIAPVEARP